MNELKAPSLQSLLSSDRDSTDSLLVESLLDFEELNDEEFSIPAISELPSLETVLSELNTNCDKSSDFGFEMTTPTSSITDESSVRFNTSLMSSSIDTTIRSGSIMHFTLLQGISSQIASAADRINAGLASSCATCHHYCAVGTSRGHILNFDINQKLCWAHQDKNGQGAVSSLAFNPECNRLLAGFARGLVLMLDTESGDCIRQLIDVVTPNTSVLHVKWTSRPALALTSDSGGSVWSLSFTRKLGVRGCSTRCLFSGARGEVCTIEPLLMHNNVKHQLDQYCIVALATLSKYFIITIRPRLKVVKYHLLNGPPDCLPVMSWQMVLIQAADTTRSVDPVLVVGRGYQLFFHQLFVSQGRLTLIFLRNISMAESIVSVHWLGPKCVGCIDISEILHLIDVRSNVELECIDVVNAAVVYASAQFKGLATGGNVSPAMALAGTHACYGSLSVRGPHLYLLGARTMHSITVRTWMERITHLINNQRWQEACDLALEIYKAALNKPKRKHQVTERIIMLFKEYIATSGCMADYCLGAIIKCMIVIGEVELLWTQLWDRLQSKELFLQHITEHIENGDINHVDTHISQGLVDYWLTISPSKVEDLVLKLDWTCLDLDQVLNAAKKYQLYRAQIYLNAKALNDYTVSLTDLIPILEERHSNLGHCLLVYISCCLAGRGYPTGNIQENLVPKVKHEVLCCLTSLHSKSMENDEVSYPYLRRLLKFNVRETINVISLAFQEEKFGCELGYAYRKCIINILLEIMTPDDTTWSEIGCLLNFIAQQISQIQLAPDPQLLKKVLSYLTMEYIENENTRLHMERENAWYELLTNNCLQNISNDEEQLQLARKAHCHYVEEYLLEKLQRYDEMIDCYLNNPLRHQAMFLYLERYAHNPNRLIIQQVLLHIKSIIRIDAKECTRLVVEHFKSHLYEILDLLSDEDDLLLAILKNLYEFNGPMRIEDSERLLELLCKYDSDSVDTFLRHSDSYRTDIALKLMESYTTLWKSCVYLAEKQNNYSLAFSYAMHHLKSSDTDQTAECARFVSALCARASNAAYLKANFTTEIHESLWFELLQFSLPCQELRPIMKSLLQEASAHVNLQCLVQLVLNTRNVSGSFGDIKDLLLGMLLQSRQETHIMERAVQIMERELSEEFCKHRKICSRGLWITITRCVICLQRLHSQIATLAPSTKAVLVLGICGHSMHEQCYLNYQSEIDSLAKCQTYNLIDGHPMDVSITDGRNHNGDKEGKYIANKKYNGWSTFQCPYCLRDLSAIEVQHSIQLAQYCDRKRQSIHTKICSPQSSLKINIKQQLGVLELKAPPRLFH